MNQNNVGTFIVTVCPEVEQKDIKRVEKEYTAKFKGIGEKCAEAMNERFRVRFFKGGLKATFWASIAAMITAILDTGFEKANEELDGLLAKANLIKVTAQQSEVNPYEMAMTQAVAARAGVSSEELQAMLLRFNYMRAQKDPTLANFQEGDSATAFLNFMQGLSSLDQNNKVLAATKIFGRFNAGKALQIADLENSEEQATTDPKTGISTTTGGLNVVINNAKKMLREKLEDFAKKRNIKIPQGDLKDFVNTVVNNANKLYGEDQAEQVERDLGEITISSLILKKNPNIMAEKTKYEDRQVRLRQENLVGIANTAKAQNKQDNLKEKVDHLIRVIQGPVLTVLTKLADTAEGFVSKYGPAVAKNGIVKGFIGTKAQELNKAEREMYEKSGIDPDHPYSSAIKNVFNYVWGKKN